MAGIFNAPGAMVDAARKRNAASVRAGRVDLRRGDAAALPFEDGTFDKAFNIHCIYFWPDPARAFGESRRVLRPNGRLATTIMPRDGVLAERPAPPVDRYRTCSGEEVAQWLVAAGFNAVRIESCPAPERFPGIAVVGCAPYEP